MSNKHYWERKEERTAIAVKHTADMEERFHNEIEACFRASRVYSESNRPCYFGAKKETHNIHICGLDSVSAIMNLKPQYRKKVAVLNFASYTNPGGKFIEGSSAQEESLCHESFLYNVLKKHWVFYNRNKAYRNNGLYTNRALYLPDVIFERGNETVLCDVITAAAPYKTSALSRGVTNEKNLETLKDRISFVMDIAATNNVSTLILGAYGCGVFGQDPTETAEIFKELLDTRYHNVFENIIFAIPKNENSIENFNAFENVFSKQIKMEIQEEDR